MTDWADLPDEELIVAYRVEREQGALSELFRRYQPRLNGWCLRFTQDREAALDLAQEVLLRAFRSLHTYRGDCRFSTWLYVIARNQCWSDRLKRANEPVHLPACMAYDVADRAASIHERVETEQWLQRSCQAIVRALSQTEAHVMMLHYGEEVSLRDITLHLGLRNKSGAKAYIVSARRKLSGLIRPNACGVMDRPMLG